MTVPAVSVIIATLDRSRYLRLCLEALARQTAAAAAFEVIVVDNGSSDDTPVVAAELHARAGNIRYVQEPRRGLSVARNAGVRAAHAPIVAFTDDDAVPDPTWVAKIASRFAALDDRVPVLGGDVRALWEAPRPAWLTDRLLRPLSAGLFWGPTARLLKSGEWLIEVNIAYRKAQLERFGGFPEHLGRIGDTLLSCDGCVNDLFTRAGLGAFYDPELIVGHHIHGSRLSRAWFRRRLFWQGISMHRVHRYIESRATDLALPPPDDTSGVEEIVIPTSAAAWAALFSDADDVDLEQQVRTLEQIGYLLQSQGLISPI